MDRVIVSKSAKNAPYRPPIDSTDSRITARTVIVMRPMITKSIALLSLSLPRPGSSRLKTLCCSVWRVIYCLIITLLSQPAARVCEFHALLVSERVHRALSVSACSISENPLVSIALKNLTSLAQYFISSSDTIFNPM